MICCILLAALLLCSGQAMAAPEGYTPAGATKNCFFFGNNGYTVEYRYDYESMLPETMQAYIDNYNTMLGGEKDVYFYFVNNSRSMDFTADLSGENDIYLDLMSRLTCVDHSAAVAPAAMIAASPATLYATQGVLDLCADTTAEGLLAYTENAPFELFIARLIDASPVDYLTLEATSALYVDQSLYMDYAEMAQAAQDGAIDLYVFGAEMPAEMTELLTPLYVTDLEGPFLGAFVHTDAAIAADAETALLTLAAQEDVQSLLQEAGYIPDSQLDSAAFADKVQELFRRYIQYLTNEGLFFYEF